MLEGGFEFFKFFEEGGGCELGEEVDFEITMVIFVVEDTGAPGGEL